VRKSQSVPLLLCVLLLGAGGVSAEPGRSETTVAPDLRDIVWRVSGENGVDPRLVDAVVRAESAYDPQAVSHKGAMGLMQLMPDTARRLEVSDPFDPEENVRGGVTEVSRLLDRYDGNLVLVLAAYNAGEGAVERYRGVPPYRETRGYVDRILRMYTGRGASFHLERRAPVRLLRHGEGVLITNGGSSSASSESPRLRASLDGGLLGGGFGRGSGS